MRTISSGIILGILSIFGGALSSNAATTTVDVGSATSGSVFVPPTANIAVNDTVTWNWVTSFHSTTSGNVPTANGLWDSGVFSPSHSFSYTFTNSGNYPYFCSIHGNFGMTGSVNVTAPNTPPVITITNPASGTVLAAPANVTIQASATDNGSVTNVQFLVGTTVLTNKTAAPFFGVTNNLVAGSYTLAAIASDNLGAKATNTVTLNVVNPVPITIGTPARTSPTNFQFSYAANIGLRYVIERSTNLLATNWLTLVTNTAASNPVNFADTNATASPGFYRVGRLPNP